MGAAEQGFAGNGPPCQPKVAPRRHAAQAKRSLDRQDIVQPWAVNDERKKSKERKMTNSFKASEDFVNFGTGAFNALVKSGQIWAEGVQALASDIAATTQARLEETAATVKSLTEAKTVQDLLALQTAAVRHSVEKAMTDTTRLAGASSRLATDTLAPLTAQLTVATGAFRQAA
jgi:phasin family protein